jgi:hypothetical protein
MNILEYTTFVKVYPILFLKDIQFCPEKISNFAIFFIWLIAGYCVTIVNKKLEVIIGGSHNVGCGYFKSTNSLIYSLETL